MLNVEWLASPMLSVECGMIGFANVELFNEERLR